MTEVNSLSQEVFFSPVNKYEERRRLLGERKRAYKRNKGFLLAANTGHQVADAVSKIRIGQLEVDPGSLGGVRGIEADVSESAAGLALVTIELTKAVAQDLRGVFNENDKVKRAEFDTRFGVTADDRNHNNNLFEFQEGLSDQEFTWHFAPSVAVDIVEHFRIAGYITKEQQDNLTFGDYADMIGSMWFSDLMHDMALTENGAYGDQGTYLDQYGYKKLHDRVAYWRGKEAPKEMFELRERTDDQDGRTYYTASLTKEFRKMLRDGMKDMYSVGCPVARRTGTLALELVKTDRHANELERNGQITFEPIEGTDRVRFVHDYTPIDRALDALAMQLDAYDEEFGTPYVHFDRMGVMTVEHVKKAKTNALSYKVWSSA